MLELLKKENNETFARTENDAAALASTGSDCLDLFASIGALRAADEEEIRRRFVRAFAEDRTTALRILFYARDIRGGLGERRVFRVVLAYLAVHAPEIVEKLLPLVAEYGRWDDVAALVAISRGVCFFAREMAALDQYVEPCGRHARAEARAPARADRGAVPKDARTTAPPHRDH